MKYVYPKPQEGAKVGAAVGKLPRQTRPYIKYTNVTLEHDVRIKLAACEEVSQGKEWLKAHKEGFQALKKN